MGLHVVLGDEHGLSLFEIKVPRKVSDFFQGGGDWNKNCMNGDFMIFFSFNKYNSSHIHLGGMGKACVAYGGQ